MLYLSLVDKTFHASGFLYNLKTHQILLLQSEAQDDVTSSWSMIGGDSRQGEDAPTTFQRVISELLNIELKPKHIYPIYDYFHDKLNKVNYVFYAEVGKNLKFTLQKDNNLSWVSFDKILKLVFPAHTKQDVVVGKRVIDAKERDEEAKDLLLSGSVS